MFGPVPESQSQCVAALHSDETDPTLLGSFSLLRQALDESVAHSTPPGKCPASGTSLRKGRCMRRMSRAHLGIVMPVSFASPRSRTARTSGGRKPGWALLLVMALVSLTQASSLLQTLPSELVALPFTCEFSSVDAGVDRSTEHVLTLFVHKYLNAYCHPISPLTRHDQHAPLVQ